MDMSCTVPVFVIKEDNTYIAKDVETSVVSQGPSIEEAMDALKEALELYYDGSGQKTGYRNVFFTTLEVCV